MPSPTEVFKFYTKRDNVVRPKVTFQSVSKYLDNFLCVSITPMSIFTTTHRYHHSPPTLNAPQNSHLELALFMIQPQLGQFIIRTSHLPCHYLLVHTVSLHISRPTFPQPPFKYTLIHYFLI